MMQASSFFQSRYVFYDKTPNNAFLIGAAALLTIESLKTGIQDLADLSMRPQIKLTTLNHSLYVRKEIYLPDPPMKLRRNLT